MHSCFYKFLTLILYVTKILCVHEEILYTILESAKEFCWFCRRQGKYYLFTADSLLARKTAETRVLISILESSLEVYISQ